MKGLKYRFQPQRENDKFIMIAFIQSEMVQWDLKRVNECRKYLQVITISCITNGSGKSFQNAI